MIKYDVYKVVNHKALYIKLMKRGIAERLLELLENLFSNCYSCVKWNNVWSSVFDIAFGVRQGSVIAFFICSISRRSCQIV